MDAKVLGDWWERERYWILALAAATVVTIGLNIYGILVGITIVLPHLFYLPIVIAAYRFQKRGFIFSVVLGFVYLGIAFFLGPTDETTLVSALSRFIVFIAIGAVVAYLSHHLTEEEERYRGLFNNSEAGAFLVRQDGDQYIIEEVNQRGATLIGQPAETLAGKPLLDLWEDKEEGRRFLAYIAGQERILRQEADWLAAEGRPISVLISSGRLPGGRQIVTAVDITDRKIAEEALKTANERLNTLGSLTRQDLLAAVSRMMEALDAGKGQFGETAVRHYLSTLEDAARYLRRRIEITRDYQDLGAEPPKWQYVQALILKEAEDMDLKGVSLRSWVERLEVYADGMLGKVFKNLIDNALRHGKTVSDIVITYQIVDDGLNLFIEDNGTGIPEGEKETIFEYRTDASQGGLGLFLSREILSITGMTIRETGTYGKGAEFVIHIPPEGYRIV